MTDLDSDAPEAPDLPKLGDWIVCASDHRNWRVLRDIQPGEPLRASDVVSPNGLHPIAGDPVGACSICGGDLLVNGNSGIRFRILRAADVEPVVEPDAHE